MSMAAPGFASWSIIASRILFVKGAWTGSATLELEPHALAPIAGLPVREIVSATHIIADLTLGLGKVVYNYLKD